MKRKMGKKWINEMRFLKKIKRYFDSEQKKVLHSWISVKGDEKLRLNYGDLNEKSIVFDVGGYKGQWASDIFSKYLCTIYVFELVKEFADLIKSKFSKNKKIIVNDFGLGNKTEEKIIYLQDDSSSVYGKGNGKGNGKGDREKIKILSIEDFIKKNEIEKIDLMKINIEGGEYELLESLLEGNFVSKIKNIQVQFHRNISFPDKRRRQIQDKLKKTHKLTYCFPFVWENWTLKV